MLEQKIQIKSYDVDHNDCLKASSLMKYFQQIAREDLDAVGMTYNFLRQHNIVFVLTKYKIVFHEKIKSDDVVILKTSPCAIHGVSFIRDFTVTSLDGKLLIEACSTWCLIDFEKRSLVRPNKLPFEIPACERLCDFLPDRTNVLANYSHIVNKTVLYSQLDSNNHLNNCYYADMIIDGLFELGFDFTKISQLEMQFDHEARLFDNLEIAYINIDGVYHVKCYNATSDKSCFIAVLKP